MVQQLCNSGYSSGAAVGSGAASLLLHVENPIAPGTRVVGVFKVLEKEWNQTAANHQPAQNEQEAGEPGEGAHFVGDVGEHLLSAAGAGGGTRRAAQLRVVAHILILGVVGRSGLNP